MKKAIADSFHEMNETISQQSDKFDPKLSGTTLTIILVTDDNQLYSANVGDSLAYLI